MSPPTAGIRRSHGRNKIALLLIGERKTGALLLLWNLAGAIASSISQAMNPCSPSCASYSYPQRASSMSPVCPPAPIASSVPKCRNSTSTPRDSNNCKPTFTRPFASNTTNGNCSAEDSMATQPPATSTKLCLSIVSGSTATLGQPPPCGTVAYPPARAVPSQRNNLWIR
jgi:hypothetical protein